MKLQELAALLAASGLPVAYHHFRTPQIPPYLIYQVEGEDLWGADDRQLLRRRRVLVELYTRGKDPRSEERLEALLAPWELVKNETYLEEEKLFLTAYSWEMVSKREKEENRNGSDRAG